jgi:hypothetical protein
MTIEEAERVQSHYLLVLIEEDIRRHWELRPLYRAMSWTDWYAGNRAETRALVRVLRQARRAVERKAGV